MCTPFENLAEGTLSTIPGRDFIEPAGRESESIPNNTTATVEGIVDLKATHTTATQPRGVSGRGGFNRRPTE